MKIAVDAMGGDNAPHAVVAGAVQAAKEFGVGVILVGIEQAVREELAKHPQAKALPIEVRNATEVVDMLDSPVTVYRRKKDSSIRVANELVKSGEAVAVISAGHTGAAMATSLFVLGKLEGVERPAIATFMPTIKGTSLILDMGANVDCKPNHLLQFAVMGDVYAKYLLKIANPRVGLLSIGEEETKGNELTKEAFKLLTETSLNFIGNVEGRDVMSGKADVIVCDGFIGNVVLKVSEAVAETIGLFLETDIEKSLIEKARLFADASGVPEPQTSRRLRGIRRRAPGRHQRHQHHQPRPLKSTGPLKTPSASPPSSRRARSTSTSTMTSKRIWS